MKKFAFLLAFLAGFSFVSQTWAQTSSPVVHLGPVTKGGDKVWAESPEPHGDDDIIPDDLIGGNQGQGSSGSEVTKSRAFTPAEAADATKDNGKNSVTINF